MKNMKNKGQMNPMHAILSAVVLAILLSITVMLIGGVTQSSGYSACVVNHTTQTVTGCSLTYSAYQMMNASNTNTATTMSLSGIMPIILVAVALIGMVVVAFMHHNG